MLNAVNVSLHPGFESHTQMSIIGIIVSLKTDFCMLVRLYDEIFQIMREVFFKDNWMINNFYDTKYQIATLGLPVEKID